MFISYEYKAYLGYDNKTKLYSYQYKIIDDNFEVIDIVGLGRGLGRGGGRGWGLGGGLGRGLIETYEKRNLQVAPNLIKAILWCHKKYGYSISELLAWNKTYNPKFAKYEEELEKYLILL
jgi:hypothetical protein